MDSYLKLCKYVLEHGTPSQDRTGTGTLSIFGYQLRHDMAQGFPLLTTKKVLWDKVLHELLWFLKGETNIRSLVEKDVHIWDAWADEQGELGPIYGAQWRRWRVPEVDPNDPHKIRQWIDFDQIQSLVQAIRHNPNDRGHIVSAWNVGDLGRMKLRPCHTLFQVYVRGGRLSLQLYQRSADLFLGVPFNIASYSALLHMLAQVTGYIPGEFVHTFGDAHLYQNHLDQIKEQLARPPRALPTLSFARPLTSLDDFTFEDFILAGYDPHPPIKAPVSV